MGEREDRRKRSARQAKAAVEKPLPVVASVPTWECATCHTRAPRGEACAKCGKRLLEG